MPSTPLITDVRLYPGGVDDLRTGLLGYLRFHIAGVVEIDGATLRRTRDGRLMVSWPSRRDAAGRERFVVRPADADARRALDAEILALVGERVGAVAVHASTTATALASTNADQPAAVPGPSPSRPNRIDGGAA